MRTSLSLAVQDSLARKRLVSIRRAPQYCISYTCERVQAVKSFQRRAWCEALRVFLRSRPRGDCRISAVQLSSSHTAIIDSLLANAAYPRPMATLGRDEGSGLPSMRPTDEMKLTPAFAPFSSFTPRLSTRTSAALPVMCHVGRCTTPTMVAPKHVRRSEEIKRLTKQLEELRAMREHMPSPTSSSEPVPSPVAEQATEPSPPAASPTSSELSQKSSFVPGKHSENSRFFSISSVVYDEYYPRILPVAGKVPGLTVQQLEATPTIPYSRNPDPGYLFLSKVPEGFTGELFAMPVVEITTECVAPVIIKVAPDEMSASQLPCDADDNVLVLLERGNLDAPFDNTKFYAWDVDGMVKIGWARKMPEESEARCLGKVIMGTLEIRKDLRTKTSCWEEENETYA